MSSPVEPLPPKKQKRVQAPRAAVWGVFALVGLGMEFIGLHRANGWGPLSNAVWVITEDSAHGVLWWLLLGMLAWISLHFLFPGERAFGWLGLLWILGLAAVAWASGRFLLHLF